MPFGGAAIIIPTSVFIHNASAQDSQSMGDEKLEGHVYVAGQFVIRFGRGLANDRANLIIRKMGITI